MKRIEIAIQINSIHLKNIDLTGVTFLDELKKIDEESREFNEALIEYLYERTEENKVHLLEELSDKFQTHLSMLNIIGIDLEELIKYWNTDHLKKLENRPRLKEEICNASRG
ncbi:hypothetical protein GND98_012330 [Clostridium butyricum]|uniref:Uncharacterized protein n=1 Tax=Clostridium butyricum TaxID=1492 RepID=A0A6L9EPT8_CLOBU|nr:hypothetical protein [Clostridium butyricum]